MYQVNATKEIFTSLGTNYISMPTLS